VKTSIQWTEQTWNPVRGCTRVSEGCRNCYAERQAARKLPGLKSPTTGEPFAIMTPSGPRWSGKVELIPHMLDIPIRRRKPTTWFVNSMSDLFHESLPFDAIDEVFTRMVAADWHTYQILTKRASRMREYFASGCHDGGWGPDRETYHLEQNIWLGVSVEDGANLNRIELLKQTPAAVRFLSLEPLLEDLGYITGYLRGIDWVIVGGESGPCARPMDLAWARSVVRQCKDAGVPCFVKQLGARAFDGTCRLRGLRKGDERLYLKLTAAGADPAEWPVDLIVREMPPRGEREVL
jgi:protein gp37